MNRPQDSDRFGANPGPELKGIAFTGAHRIGDRVDAVTKVIDIGVVARAAGERIIPDSTGDDVVAGTGIHDVVAAKRVDHVVPRSGRDRIIPFCDGRSEETGKTRRGAVRKGQSLNAGVPFTPFRSKLFNTSPSSPLAPT